MSEGIKTGLDTVLAAIALARAYLAALADSALDLLSGRRLPEPDLKSVAEAPEPGAICRLRHPRATSRTSRASRSDQAA